jgi:hypothetical protein
MDKNYICSSMSIKFSGSANSNRRSISGGFIGSEFRGFIGSVVCRKFRSIWCGVIIGI